MPPAADFSLDMRSPPPLLPLPPHWPRLVQSGVLHALAIAHQLLTASRSWAADSPLARVRLAAEVERLKGEIGLLQRELDVKDERFKRVPPPRRPHYAPKERMEILSLRIARGWTVLKAAERFLVTVATLSTWMKRLDEGGEAALLATRVPVNKFPDHVRLIVHELRSIAPVMGTLRIAQLLARAGLHVAKTTVRRWKRAQPGLPPAAPTAPTLPRSGRTVVAKHTDHVWGIDLSSVSTSDGRWVPWPPFFALPRSPFSWWIAAIVDYYSRSVVGFAVFRRYPTAAEIVTMLRSAKRRHRGGPKYIVTDKGAQFQGDYLAWCASNGIKARFGAIGKHGSIAIVERFWRSLKAEAFPLRLVPLGFDQMRALLSAYVGWFNAHRPHQGLGGATPLERAMGVTPANQLPRFEPRARYPDPGDRSIRKMRPARLTLRVVPSRNAEHLPVVNVDAAA